MRLKVMSLPRFYSSTLHQYLSAFFLDFAARHGSQRQPWCSYSVSVFPRSSFEKYSSRVFFFVTFLAKNLAFSQFSIPAFLSP